MKYVILNDLSYVFRKKYKIILAYIFIFTLYFYLIKDTYVETNSNILLNNVLGTTINYKILISDSFNASMLILNYGLFIFLSISLYLKDMDNYDNFSFRINIKKWVICKIIVMFIICSLINFIIFFNVYLNNILEIECFIILVKKIIMLILFIAIIYLAMLYFNKSKIFSIFLLIVMMIIFFYGFDLEKINLIYLMIIMLISLLLLIKGSKIIKFSDLKE